MKLVSPVLGSEQLQKLQGLSRRKFLKTAVASLGAAGLGAMHAPEVKADSYTTVGGVDEKREPMSIEEATEFAFNSKKIKFPKTLNKSLFSEYLLPLYRRDKDYPEVFVKDLELISASKLMKQDDFNYMVLRGNYSKFLDIITEVKRISRKIKHGEASVDDLKSKFISEVELVREKDSLLAKK